MMSEGGHGHCRAGTVRRAVPESAMRWTSVVVGLFCALWMASATAQTPVSGAITVNTTWTAEHSPYRVVSDVIVDNGAILRIEPGTVVLMTADANLVVQYGGLIAVGQSDARIVLTSEHDADGSGTTPSPGDWGAVEFRNGTIDAVSVLENVDLRYGHGISILHASPTLKNLAIDHHVGAAISLDLHSSPSGGGLSATGNDLNGILVPAGLVDGDVVWALKGIPYVVAEGIIGIGMADLDLAPPQLSLWPGQSSQLVVSLPDPATSNLRVDVVSTHPSVVSLGDLEFIIVPAGEQHQSFEVSAVGLGAAEVVVSAEGMGVGRTEISVSPEPRIDLQPSSVTLPLNQSAALTVVLNETAGDGGIEVTLSSSPEGHIQHSATVTVPAGQTSVEFEFAAMEEGEATIEATVGGFIPGQAQVTILPPNSILLPPHMVLAPGTARDLRVELSTPAPDEGLDVEVLVGDQSVVTAPTVLHIEGGSSFAEVRLDAVAFGETSVTMSATGYGSASTQIVVEDIWIEFNCAGSCYIHLPEGSYDLLHVGLSQPAPIGGVHIDLSTSTVDAISVSPESVFIAEGQMQSQHPARIDGLAQGGWGAVHATADGFQSGELSINVVGPARLELSKDRIALGRGLVIDNYDYHVGFFFDGLERVQQGFKANYDRTIQIVLSGAEVHAPMEVVIPAGEAYVPLPLTGVQITESPVELTVFHEPYQPSQSLIDVVPPELEFAGLAGARAVGSSLDDFRVMWHPVAQPGGDGISCCWMQQYGAEEKVVAVSIVHESPAGMVVENLFDESGIPVTQTLLPAGADGSASLSVSSPSGEGEYRIGATIAGPHGGTWTSDLQVVTSPYLRVRRYYGEIDDQLTVGVGMRASHTNTDVVVERVVGRPDVGFQPYRVSSGLVVDMESSDSAQAFVSVPGQVTIPSGMAHVRLAVNGIAETSIPVQIRAAANGHGTYEVPLSVDVVPAALELAVLDGVRSRFSGRDNFWLRPARIVQPDGGLMTQVPTTSITVDLAVFDADPPDIVTDFYVSATGGAAVLTRTIPSFSTLGVQSWVGRPTSDTGFYRIRATSQGAPVMSVESDLQEVRRPVLRVRRDVTDPQSHRLNVGMGMTAGPTLGTGNRVVVERLLNGSPLGSPDPSEITLHHEGAGILNVTTSGMGSNTATAQLAVSGLSLTQQPIAITASAEGHDSHEQPLLVSVVPPPGIRTWGLDYYRSVMSGRDDFRVELLPVAQEGGYWMMKQGLTEGRDLAISVVEASPPSVVEGIYESEEGVEPIEVVEFPSGVGQSTWFWVGQPVTVGTYKVMAELVGMPGMTTISEIQTVRPEEPPPEIEFNVDTLKLGVGLVTDDDEVFVHYSGGHSAAQRAPERRVALACSSPLVCNVADDARIQAGVERSTSIRLVGTGIGRARLQTTNGEVRRRDTGVDVEVVAAVLDATATPARVAVNNEFQLQVRTGLMNGQVFMQRRPVEPLEVDVVSDNPGVLSVPRKAVIDPASGVVVLPGAARAAGTARITASAPGMESVMVTVRVVN